MKNKLTILALFLIITLGGLSKNLYTDYDHRTFSKLKSVNALIVLDQIKINLLSAAIFHETNAQRIKYKRKPFNYSGKLKLAAQGHSSDMARLNFFSHTSKLKGKKSFLDRINGVNYYGYYYGENIVYSFSLEDQNYLDLAKHLVKLWMSSDGHRKNILNKNFKDLGCGIYLSSNHTYYATQNFGG